MRWRGPLAVGPPFVGGAAEAVARAAFAALALVAVPLIQKNR